MGKERYPDADSLMIAADSGGSNRLWKTELQKFADETGMAVLVRRFPPGTSEWNKIEQFLKNTSRSEAENKDGNRCKASCWLWQSILSLKGRLQNMRILRPDKTDLEVLLGDPRKAIESMVIPLLVAMAVVEINQFVDTFWVAGLGNVSAEAVATVTPIYGLMMCAGLGIGVGATTTIAFQLGNGNRERANGLALNSLILGAIFAVASSIAVALLFDPALEFMGAADVRSESWGYMLPLAVLSPALLINSIMGGMLRGEGAAKKSTVMQMSAAIMNMAIDPILIYGLGLGVMGAGLSTAISALLSLAIGLRWYAKGKTAVSLGNGSFRADASMMKEILGVGGPKTVQSMISNLTDFVHRIFLIVAGGTTAVMLYNYPWRYIGLVNLPGRAFENAMVPVCSAAYGKSDLEKMKAGTCIPSRLRS